MTDATGGTRGWWDLAADVLRGRGVERVFGLPGDDMQALGAFADRAIDVVVARSQRAAAFMALGYARTAGGPGVVIVGRGPGVAGVLPAMLEASTGGPGLVVLAGGAPVGAVRAETFQYAPQLALVGPLVASACRLEAAAAVPAAVAAAFDLAGGPPDAVTYVEIPDAAVDRLPGAPGPLTVGEVPRAPQRPSEASVPTPDLLREARRPVILVGGGCRGLDPGRLTRLAERFGAAVVCTASGRGVMPENHPKFLGCAGLYLHPQARAVLAEADLVVVLGSRLEETAVEGVPGTLPVLQVNIDPSGFSYAHPGELVRAEVADVVRSWRPDAPPDPSWCERVASARTLVAEWAQDTAARHPVAGLVRSIVEALPPGSVLCQENGLLDIWSYLHPLTRLPPGVSVIAPSEQTTLGFGCAAALGAAYGPGTGPVLVVTGDGAAATITDEVGRHPRTARGVVLLVLDNDGFGWLERQHRSVNDVRGVFVGDSAGPPDALSPEAATQEALQALARTGPGAVRTVRVRATVEDGPPVLSDVW